MDNNTISGAASVAGASTVTGAGTVAGASTITAKESVLTRVKALISSIETDLEHDEEAIVAWIKAHL